MTLAILVECILIAAARATDVSLGTLRIMMVVQGRRGAAFLIGFVEMSIWLTIILNVISKLNTPYHIAFYALGFAFGNYIGIGLERRLALGDQVLRIFTRNPNLVTILRERGRSVTRFEGEGLDGNIYLLYIKLKRKDCMKALAVAREVDPKLFYIIENITESSKVTAEEIFGTEWWRLFLKK